MTIRCFVVDDEPLARAGVEAELARHAGFEVVASLGHPMHALEELVARPPDLLFLDVKMPGLDGFAFLERMREELDQAARPYVVLVTAFDRYALAAFDYEALDYLVKPFDSERFADTLRRAQERIRTRRAETDPPEPRGEATASHRLRLSVSGGELFLAPDDIRWIEAADHYLLIHGSARTHLVRARISDLEEALAPHGFLRVHRGALVHPAHVERTETQPDGGRRLHLSDGSLIRVSRRRWPGIRDRFA